MERRHQPVTLGCRDERHRRHDRAVGRAHAQQHLDVALGLEAALVEKGKDDLLAEVQHATDLATVHSIRQGEALGLGHAILQARAHVGDDTSFVVALGDDVIDPHSTFLESMIAQHEATGRPVVALMEVPQSDVSKYGIAQTEPTDTDGVVRITGLVEKPSAEEAPSNLAIIGRYVLAPSVFEVLRKTEPGRGGEIQLTDAIETLVATEPVHGVVFRGRRYDTGDRLDYLKAVVQLAADREDLGPPLLDWLQTWLPERR
ncbi:MAG: UTP--glucose-1-phosphate uridylyltransferase, partial [Proteobacteria bacterium]|nr:UTP--glucose-1-phosphate uridylyltransferase [Pseudomonadota bacterium]